jgi:hypothetical protein
MPASHLRGDLRNSTRLWCYVIVASDATKDRITFSMTCNELDYKAVIAFLPRFAYLQTW